MLWHIDQPQAGLQNCVAIMHLRALPPVCSKYIAEFDSRTTGSIFGPAQNRDRPGSRSSPRCFTIFGTISLLTRFQIQRVFQN